MGKKRVLIAATLAMAGVKVFGVPALAGTMLTATLSGAAEVPADSSGTADLNLLPKRERICHTITVENIEPATAAHIHRGTSTEVGPIVKELKATVPPAVASGAGAGCSRRSGTTRPGTP